MTKGHAKQRSKKASSRKGKKKRKAPGFFTRLAMAGRAARQRPLLTAIIGTCLVGLTVWAIVALCTLPKTGPLAGNRAPDFTLQTTDGQTVSLRDYRGKMVMASFWATWCDPCVDEMPYIQAAFEDSPDEDLVILAINVGQSAEKVRSFVADRGLTLPVLLDPEMATTEQYDLREGLPVTVFIDTRGIIQKVRPGTFGGQRQVENTIRALRYHQPIDEAPPIIPDVSLSATDSTVTVSWATDEPTTGRVSYRQLDGYHSWSSPEPEESLVVYHSVTIGELNPATTYQVAVASHDAFGNRADHDAGTITTFPVGPEVDMYAPDFTLPGTDGQNVTLSDFRGRIVMVIFWQSDCKACSSEMPHIQAVFQRWSDEELAILAVSVRESANKVRSFAESQGLTFPILLDSEGVVDELYQPPVFPTAFFVDAQGIIREVKEGRFHSPEEIEAILDSL